MRKLMVEVRPSLERARFDKTLSDDREYPGEKYLPVFLSDVLKLLQPDVCDRAAPKSELTSKVGTV
jgi:hypothetical protein